MATVLKKIKVWIVSGIDINEDTDTDTIFSYDLWIPKVFMSEHDAKEFLIKLVKQKIKERYDNLVLFNDNKIMELNFFEIMEIGKRLLKNPCGDDVLDFNFQISEEEIELK